MLHLGRFVVFINAEESHIQIETRVLEVVRVATIESNLLFGCKHQANIRVFFESIKMVGTTLIKGDNIAAKAGFVQRFLLNLGHDSPARGECLLGFGTCLYGCVNPGGYIFYAHQHIQFHGLAFGLFRMGFCMEAIAIVVAILGTHLLQGVCGDMVIGHNQSIGTDKGTGSTAVESYRGFLQMLQPFVGGFEVVFGFKMCLGRVVEQPHALIAQEG